MATVVTDIIPDPLTGATFYRVSRVFPSAASAARAVMLLESVVPQAFGPPDVLNQATNVAESATPEGVLTAGEFQATRQHEAAEGGEQSPCIGSICSVGE